MSSTRLWDDGAVAPVLGGGSQAFVGRPTGGWAAAWLVGAAGVAAAAGCGAGVLVEVGMTVAGAGVRGEGTAALCCMAGELGLGDTGSLGRFATLRGSRLAIICATSDDMPRPGPSCTSPTSCCGIGATASCKTSIEGQSDCSFAPDGAGGTFRRNGRRSTMPSGVTSEESTRGLRPPWSGRAGEAGAAGEGSFLLPRLSRLRLPSPAFSFSLSIGPLFGANQSHAEACKEPVLVFLE